MTFLGDCGWGRFVQTCERGRDGVIAYKAFSLQPEFYWGPEGGEFPSSYQCSFERFLCFQDRPIMFCPFCGAELDLNKTPYHAHP